MDYLFRMADGRRLALWSEKNQIIRQLSGGGGNRSHMTLRTDFLSDFSAASMEGKIYFVYQNTSRRVMLYLPDGEEDRMLFGESIESCRHSGMMLKAWRGRLYLFYLAFSPIRERYSLRVRKILENGEVKSVSGYESGDELVLYQDFLEVPEFQIVSENDYLRIMTPGKIWQLTVDEADAESWQTGAWIDEKGLAQCEEMKQETERMSAENHRLQEENQELRADKVQLGEKAAGLERKVLEAETAREEHRGRVEILQMEIRSLSGDKKQYMEEIERLAEENQKLRTKQEQEILTYHAKLQSAVNQYNELAGITRQLQAEGKKWRDKYYQEMRKKERKTNVKRASE